MLKSLFSKILCNNFFNSNYCPTMRFIDLGKSYNIENLKKLPGILDKLDPDPIQNRPGICNTAWSPTVVFRGTHYIRRNLFYMYKLETQAYCLKSFENFENQPHLG